MCFMSGAEFRRFANVDQTIVGVEKPVGRPRVLVNE